jgi:hypothetical protein
MNSENVMAALKLCADGCDDNGCSYLEESTSRGGLAACRCIDLLAKDVLELLKEQAHDLRTMFNRCEATTRALAGGGACKKCGLRDKCQSK